MDDGVYPFHHFHTIAHKVLGIASGCGHVMFGGPAGRAGAVRAGDVVVIPAGVAHHNLISSRDLLVIVAYPGGADWDLLKGDPANHLRR